MRLLPLPLLPPSELALLPLATLLLPPDGTGAAGAAPVPAGSIAAIAAQQDLA